MNQNNNKQQKALLMEQFFNVVNPTLVGVITLNIVILGIVYSILIDVARIDKSKKGANILKFHNSTPPIHMVWGSLLYLCAVYFIFFMFYHLNSPMNTITGSESLEGESNVLISNSFSNITYILLGIGILWPPIWYLRTVYLAKKVKFPSLKLKPLFFQQKTFIRILVRRSYFLLLHLVFWECCSKQ